jgi:hypothetical protein
LVVAEAIMKFLRWLPLLAAASLFSSAPVRAHHGAADYDRDQLLTIKGTVVDYELVNPHTEILVRGGPEGKDPVEWRVESVSLNMMVRVGWKRDSLKPGDAVTVTGHPGKNGKPAMLLVKLVLPDGHELSAPYE